MINSNRPRFTSLHVGLHGTGAITATYQARKHKAPPAQVLTRSSEWTSGPSFAGKWFSTLRNCEDEREL